MVKWLPNVGTDQHELNELKSLESFGNFALEKKNYDQSCRASCDMEAKLDALVSHLLLLYNIHNGGRLIIIIRDIILLQFGSVYMMRLITEFECKVF